MGESSPFIYIHFEREWECMPYLLTYLCMFNFFNLFSSPPLRELWRVVTLDKAINEPFYSQAEKKEVINRVAYDNEYSSLKYVFIFYTDKPNYIKVVLKEYRKTHPLLTKENIWKY